MSGGRGRQGREATVRREGDVVSREGRALPLVVLVLVAAPPKPRLTRSSEPKPVGKVVPVPLLLLPLVLVTLILIIIRQTLRPTRRRPRLRRRHEWRVVAALVPSRVVRVVRSPRLRLRRCLGRRRPLEEPLPPPRPSRRPARLALQRRLCRARARARSRGRLERRGARRRGARGSNGRRLVVGPWGGGRGREQGEGLPARAWDGLWGGEGERREGRGGVGRFGKGVGRSCEVR